MYSLKGKGKKSKAGAKSTTGDGAKQTDDKNGIVGETDSNNRHQASSEIEFQKLCNSVENQEKQQEQMYQDLKLIFQELIQQKIERQDFLQKQEHAITELYRTLDAKLESSALQMKEEMKEMQSSIIKKIESSRGYVKDVKDFKETMLIRLDEERNYLKGKIRDVQKDLMNKIIDVTQMSDEGVRELLGKAKSSKSRLSWFSKRGEHRRGAEFEQNEELQKGHEHSIAKTDSDAEQQDEGAASKNVIPRRDSEEGVQNGSSNERIDDKIPKVIARLEVSHTDKLSFPVSTPQTVEISEERNDRTAPNLDKEREDVTEAQMKTESHDGEQNPGSHSSTSSSKEFLTALESIQAKFQGSCQDMQQEVLDSVEDKLGRVMRSVDVSLTAVKHEVVDIVENEAQLLRDRLSHKYQPRPTYTCDFYVKYIRDMIKNGDSQTGPPWYIDQLGSSIKGYVETVGNGDMYVTLMYGRHPAALGMTPRPAVKLKVKATIKDVTGALPDVVVGEVIWYCDEAGIRDNRIRGKKIGVVSCRALLSNGYGEREGYGFCSMLIRYDIVVC